MKAKKSVKSKKGKTAPRSKASAAKKPARAKAAPAKRKAAPAAKRRTAAAATEKYSQTGAPWWKAHL
jgi:hypothetical protein